MKTVPYLFFNGDCEAAFRFYEQELGAKLGDLKRNSDMPGAVAPPPGIMHANMKLGDDLVMASDAPGNRYEKPRGFRLSLDVATAEEAQRVFTALARGGQVDMPLEATFFAERFGMVTDRFAIPWMVHCHLGMKG